MGVVPFSGGCLQVEALRMTCNGVDANLAAAVAGGAAPLIPDLLKSPLDAVVKQACSMVKQFAANEAAAVGMAAAGAYPPLVALLASSNADTKKAAVEALRALACMAGTHAAMTAVGGLATVNAQLVAAGSTAVASAATAAAAGGPARVPALFDTGCKSAEITLTDGGKVMKAAKSGRFHVYATVPLTRAAGGGAFEFHYNKDKAGDEGVCVCVFVFVCMYIRACVCVCARVRAR